MIVPGINTSSAWPPGRRSSASINARAARRSAISILSSRGTGTGSVTQAGTGTTILTAQSSYTGGTVINAGTLRLGADPNFSYGATPGGVIRGTVTVNAGAS